MLRPTPSLLALLAAATFSGPVVAADYWGDDMGDMSGGFRDGYPTEPGDWAGLGDHDDGLTFEFGMRYYYSMGAQSFTINSPEPTDSHGQQTESDTTQFVEGHLRIDDAPTRTFAKALAGYGYSISGTASDNSGTVDVLGGHLGYAGADIGYSLFGDTKSFALSPFVGYMYWNDSPNTYSDNFVTQNSSDPVSYDPSTGQIYLPGNSVTNDINLHMLRLGVSADANLGGFFDISAEVAAVPYAKVNGTLGAGSGDPTSHAVQYDNPSVAGPHGPTGANNIDWVQTSATNIDGWGYGGMAQAMIGIHPTENLAIRLGGRFWYVQGVVDATYDRATISDPTDSTPPDDGPPIVLNPPNFDTAPIFANQTYVTRDNPFSMMRYGLLAEVTYSF